jgi:twitching motility two-component system response regulator PilH
MNILLIEPDALLGKTYKVGLERAGHSVVVCRHAQSAVAAAEKSVPDIILLELQLPGHSGVEFLYEFRSYPEWQDIPVILHTWVPKQDVVLQQRLNISEHLYKPTTNLRQLVRAVSDLASMAA